MREIITICRRQGDVRNVKTRPDVIEHRFIYAAAATTGAGVGSAGLVSSVAAGATSDSAAGAAASVAGFSRGATGAGSSIFGGFSSTFSGWEISSFGFDLKRAPTRAERRRPTFAALTLCSSS